MLKAAMAVAITAAAVILAGCALGYLDFWILKVL